MQTIITSKEFQNKVRNKYFKDNIELIIENISNQPKIGKKFNGANNLYKLKIGLSLNKKYEYNLIYSYQGSNKPIFVINIFKSKEKDLISKVISCLITETLNN